MSFIYNLQMKSVDIFNKFVEKFNSLLLFFYQLNKIVW